MYTLFIKGWGEDEGRYYAVSKGDCIDTLVNTQFADWQFEANYYVMDNATLDTVREAVINEGVY
jgi:hypothetical protein